MDLNEYASCDGVALAGLVKEGAVDPAALVRLAGQAAERVNPRLNALSQPLFDEPLDYDGRGPFAGVPFLLKDSHPVAAGVRFSVGSRYFADAVAEHDAEITERFRAAGFASIGVTTVPEMAISFATESVRYGPTRNPWDLSRGVGGSSGGAAALVAAGVVPIAHGNDGAGSIRIPAACCGVVGLKPTRGRTPVGPGASEALFGLAIDFVLARTLRDVAHTLDAVQGAGRHDKQRVPPGPVPYRDLLPLAAPRLRVAVTTKPWTDAPVDAEVAAVTGEVARVLGELGHDVGAPPPAVDAEAVLEAYTVLTTLGIAGVFDEHEKVGDDRLEQVTLAILDEARRLNAYRVARGFQAADAVTAGLRTYFDGVDLLVTPTLARLPAPHGTLDYDRPGHTARSWLRSIFEYGPFTEMFNLGGQPAISLPLGQSATGLPIGVQLVAAEGREDLLLQVASALEERLPWSSRRPPVHAAGAP
ncbi:amidase [Planomonospora sp. ID67723]|uniref:amidase n=1 Tax=Planomonospora sp. ID67723 TaxID=2738134 RepID=UPI0018C360BC|nr:amidase [Planomonospora sp. ID67723]MBG0832689.1 amidase [Planomonospora sp. ID67723]